MLNVSIKDPDGFIWSADWRKTAICEEGPGGEPVIAKRFAERFELVPFNPEAPRNRTDAEARGLPLVRADG